MIEPEQVFMTLSQVREVRLLARLGVAEAASATATAPRPDRNVSTG